MADWQAALTYIDSYWPTLIRENRSDSRTLIGLPHPYVAPAEAVGQRMFQEMYYWDSFFTALGLFGTPHAGLIAGMAENMAALYRRFGVIPNASRFYFLSRSQPPFFTQMIRLGYRQKREQGDPNAEGWLAEMMALAADEHETVWLGAAQPHHRKVYRGLSRHFDINYLDILAACETGWDHSPRFDERCLAHLPVDLNALLYLREQDLAWAAQQRGDGDGAAAWERRAEERAAVIHELMWDDEEGFFFDYDYVRQERNPYPSLAGFYPLFAGLATVAQAEDDPHAQGGLPVGAPEWLGAIAVDCDGRA
jgi:alpha,alpha-trehalase